MDFKQQLLALSLASMSSLAFAGMGQVSGDTTCMTFSAQDPMASEEILLLPCQYEANIGGSMSYMIEQINFTLEYGQVFETENSSTFNFDSNGEAQNIERTVTLNGEDAQTLYMDYDTLEFLNEDELDDYYNQESSESREVLICFTSDSHKGLFCYPYDLLDGSR